MRAVLGTFLAAILIIVMVFSNFTPTEQFQTKQSIIDYSLSAADTNIARSFESFKDMNGGQDNTMLGQGIYHFATGLKHDYYAVFYFGGYISEMWPRLTENINLLVVLLVLFVVAPALPITFLILLSIILLIKERFFNKKEKEVKGVWKND